MSRGREWVRQPVKLSWDEAKAGPAAKWRLGARSGQRGSDGRRSGSRPAVTRPSARSTGGQAGIRSSVFPKDVGLKRPAPAVDDRLARPRSRGLGETGAAACQSEERQR